MLTIIENNSNSNPISDQLTDISQNPAWQSERDGLRRSSEQLCSRQNEDEESGPLEQQRGTSDTCSAINSPNSIVSKPYGLCKWDWADAGIPGLRTIDRRFGGFSRFPRIKSFSNPRKSVSSTKSAVYRAFPVSPTTQADLAGRERLRHQSNKKSNVTTAVTSCNS